MATWIGYHYPTMKNSHMDSLLNRVRKVTAKTAQSLRRELRFIEQEKHRLTAELDSAAQRIAESIAQLDKGSPMRSFAKAPGAPRGQFRRRWGMA